MKYAFTVAVAVALAALVAATGPAAAKSLPHLFEKAEESEKEGRVEEALELYRLVIREWPDDPERVPVAHYRVARLLAKSGKTGAALEWCREIRAKYPGHERLLAEAEELERALAKQEKKEDAKPAGARELEERYRELERREADLRRKAEELERREREANRRREEAERAVREAPGIERDVHREREEAERVAREHETAILRREFVRIAERLGIPGEKAERFLAEHSGHRGDAPAKDRDAVRDRELAERIEALTGKLGHLFERLERVEVRLKELERAR